MHAGKVRRTGGNEGIIPAPYMARNHWVAMLDMNALRQPEIKELIAESYQMILEKLPKKKQAELELSRHESSQS